MRVEIMADSEVPVGAFRAEPGLPVDCARISMGNLLIVLNVTYHVCDGRSQRSRQLREHGQRTG